MLADLTINPKKIEISIRVDENNKIGSGHINRCIALASILKDKFEVVFYIYSASMISLNTIKKDFNLVIIENNNNFISQIDANRIVILDGYHFTSALQKKIKQKNCLLVSIDERLNIQYFADVIISYSPQIKSISFKKMKWTKCYLGFKYLFLKNDFLVESKKQKLIDSKLQKSVLISFGGADKENLSTAVVKILLNLNIIDSIFILVGPCNINSFHEFYSNPTVKLIYSADARKIIKIANKSLFAITSPSTIMLELFAVGLPIISGYSNKRQIDALNFLAQRGLLHSVGYFYNKNVPSNLMNAIKLSLSNPSKYIKKQKLIFKNQERNIVSIFERLSCDL